MLEFERSCRRMPALLHQVLHPGAAFDDDEAVRLLDHHPDQAGRRRQAIAAQIGKDDVLRLDHGQGAHRLVAVLEPLVPGAAVGAGRPLNDAAAFPAWSR